MPSQSFYELLKNRRAVRSYTGEPVPGETLRRKHDEVVKWNRWSS